MPISNIASLNDYNKYEQFLQNRKEPLAIYLAVNTNIKSFNNICPSKEDYWMPTSTYKDHDLDKFYNPKFGIYLGKIVFEKRANKLIPNYMPTSIENLEEELKKINSLWLAEENPHYIDPELHQTTERGIYYIDSPNKLKFQCKIEKNTQVLTQEQILSYVKQIHSKNVKMIQNYMDTIKKNFGIKPYVFDDDFYEELGNLGIIKKEEVEGFQKGYYSLKDSVTLNMLDYLAMQNKHNEDYLITFDDELFYDYFVNSLKGFTIEELYQGMLQDEIKLLFNPAAYIDDTKVNYRKLSQEFIKRYEKELNDIGFEKKHNVFINYYGKYFRYDGFFYTNKYQGSKYAGFNLATSLISPNVIYCNEDGSSYYDKKKLTPSAFGKYYFELIDQEKIYIELLHPYYPSSKDLPKGWNNKMLEKANLK